MIHSVRRVAAAAMLVVLVATSACNPLAPAATPTPAPLRLADAALQQAALLAVQDYAERHSYTHREPSLSILLESEGQVVVHATVAFQTRSGLPFEEYDALFPVNKSGDGWTADRISNFAKVEWDRPLVQGPVTLKSPAGFTVQVPAGWAGYVMPESTLLPANVCGVGTQVSTGVPLMVVVPSGYSPDNTPIVMRSFQQCPRAASLSNIQQFLDNVRKTDTTLRFERLETIQLGGRTGLVAVMFDDNDTVAYDYYVMHRDRQLEFVIQAHAIMDLEAVLGVLNSLQFN